METNSLGEFGYNSLTIYYRRGTEDEKVIAHSFDKDIFFKEIPSFRPGKAPVIIDVGAHIGTFSILAAIRFPESRVFSIEASRQSFEILQKNIASNHLPVKAFHNALYDKSALIRLFHNTVSGNWGHSVTKEFSGSYEEVRALSFEEFVVKNGIQFIDLIKFNCEGAEFNILLNTPEAVIRKIGLAIVLYHEDLAMDQYRGDDLKALFERNSFRTHLIHRSRERGWLIAWNRKTYSDFYFLYSAIRRKLRIK